MAWSGGPRRVNPLRRRQYVFFIISSRIEHHSLLLAGWAFKNEPSTYAPLGIKDALAPAYKELHFVHYTHFGNADAVPALGAPITEFAIANVKEGVDVARVDEATNDLVAKIIAAIPEEATPGGRGTIVGEPRKFVICLGWHSVEVSPPVWSVAPG